MAAVNAEREIQKVEATIDKMHKELKLAEALTRRYEAKAASSTFNGYTAAETEQYKKDQDVVRNHPLAILRQQQLLAALNASRAAKPVFKTALVGEEGDDGCFYYEDEEQFLDMMYEGNDEDMDEGAEEWAKEEEDEMAAFASVTAQLKKMGFDPASFTPAEAAKKPPTSSSTGASAMLPHELKQSSGGDNDILRYAKFGDLEAFRNEENIEGVNLALFRDNNKRSCLHYAADGGSLELVRYLTSERGLSPVQEDDKGLTPLAIAVILQRKACVDEMVSYLRTKEKYFVASSLLDPVAQSLAHIPNPPRFIMSKGAPALPPNTRQHGFWGTHQATTIEGVNPIDVSSSDFNAEGVVGFLSSDKASVPNSYLSWLSPLSASLLPTLPRNTFAVYTPNCDVIGMSSLMAGATLLAGQDRRNISSAVALIGNIAIGPEYRKGADASTILGLMRTALINKGAKLAVFTTPAPGPAQVSTPVTRVKWYRRTINTLQLIDHTELSIVKELYPDFVKYDATLRIDSHLKSLFKDSNQLSHSWVDVKKQGVDDAKAYAKAILSVMDTELPKVSECHFLFDGVDELIDNLLNANEVFVLGTPTKVTDVVILASRSSRALVPGTTTSLANAAIHVFSLFTTLKDENRLLEMTKIAGSLMGADVFYASNTHGLTEDNFRVAMLEEQSAYSTNLFVMGENFQNIAKVEAKKVFLPFAQL